ncbi:hypothetical protein BH20PSE1_BH20PSE1_24490 [soil metagenome]
MGIVNRLRLIYDATGQAVELVGAWTDVSNHKALEQELIRARDEARQATQAKSEFLANVSHEIRTPMNGLIGLEVLKQTPLSAEQDGFVETAAHSAEILLAILNDILDFSKIEAGKMEIETVAMDLREVAEEVCASFAKRAHDKGLELLCFLPVDLPCAVEGDPTRLRQILTNLLSNAIKFTEQGEITLRACRIGDTDERVQLRFEVQDTGIGMSPEGKAKLFQPFVQADGSTTRRFGGTGLGLSICKNLAALMGSEIEVKTTEGRGSTFWLILNLAKRPATPCAPTVHDGLPGARVLIVDDNATNRQILEHYVSAWRMKPTSCASAAKALALLRESRDGSSVFDFMLLDMQMPEMDGLMLSAAMNQDPILRQIPRVLLSSTRQITQSERRQAGIAASLVKPVRASELFDALIRVRQGDARADVSSRGAARPLPASFAGHRVLLVEDNEVNQTVGRVMLGRLGLEVSLANNGREALAAIDQACYDLVFMDCQMPEMDGYEATRSLREKERAAGSPRLPVIALTANAMIEDHERCLAAGMDGYLAKPVRLEGLCELLERWLSRSVPSLSAPPAGATSPAAAAIDPTTFAALQACLGDAFPEIVAAFLTDAPRRITAMKDALAQCDAERLCREAHSLKSTSATLGAGVLSALCRTLEQEAKAGQSARAGRRIAGIEQALGELVPSLRSAPHTRVAA